MLKPYFPLFQLTTKELYCLHKAADRGKKGGWAEIQRGHDIAI